MKSYVSVIVPFHNASPRFCETLDSLEAQDYPYCEFILVDDGSTDDSARVANDFVMRDNRFTYVYQECAGAGAARNYGFSLSNGEFIIFLDSDDLFESTMLREMHKALVTTNADVCVCESVRFRDGGYSFEPHIVIPSEAGSGLRTSKDLRNIAILSGNQPPWNKMVRRSLLTEHGICFQEIANNNDAFYSAMVMLCANKVFFMRKALVRYRYGTGSSVQDTKSKDPLCALQAAELIWKTSQPILQEKSDRGTVSVVPKCFDLLNRTVEQSVWVGAYDAQLHRRVLADIVAWDHAGGFGCKEDGTRARLGILLRRRAILKSSYKGVNWCWSKMKLPRETKRSGFKRFVAFSVLLLCPILFPER